MSLFFNSKFQGFVHRGDATIYTENTIEAFKEAAILGFQYIESDLRRTKDGKIITFHDPRMQRITGSRANINEMTLANIRMQRLPKKERIPTLDELLEEFPETFFNLDLKVSGMVAEVLKKLKTHNAEDRVCLGSFSSNTIREINSMNPKINTSMGQSQVALFRFFNIKNDSNAIQIPVKWMGIKVLTKEFLNTCHENGLKVHVWTINEETSMQNLINMGVDGIMTDNPSALMKLMKRNKLI